MNRLPGDLLARAFRARNGELAWRREDALAVAEALAAGGQAILGGEVWLVDDDGWWDPRLPTDDGTEPAVRTWAPVPPERQASESWSEFCARARDYTAAVLAAAEAEALVPAPLRARLRYHLSVTTEPASRCTR
jgi:hypothetical protein